VKKVMLVLIALLAVRILPKALRHEARTIALLSTLFETLLVMASSNTSKTGALENRAGALEERVGTLEKGTFVNLQSGGIIGQLNSGLFTNVQGNTVQMTAASGSTLHCQALSQLSDTSNTSFLSQLSKTQSPGGVPTDPYSGTTFVSGERALMNNWPQAINAILGTFINNGFMNAA